MNESEVQNTLLSLIRNLLDARDEVEGEDDDISLAEIARDMVADLEGLTHASTFEEAQLLTGNRGLVLRMADRSEFQVSIVKSR